MTETMLYVAWLAISCGIELSAHDLPPTTEPVTYPIAVQGDVGEDGVASLKDQLQDGLQARLPREFAFVDHVVKLVNEGKLPRSLVDSTFLWARPKKPYPFPYFERALRIRAARIGVAL